MRVLGPEAKFPRGPPGMPLETYVQRHIGKNFREGANNANHLASVGITLRHQVHLPAARLLQ